MPEVRSTRPELTTEQADEAKALAQRYSRPPPARGSAQVCSHCNNQSVYTTDDLEWEETRSGVLLLVVGLNGAKCAMCHNKWFDARSIARIEQARRRFQKGNYEIKVAKVGGNTPGMYFPRDLVRVMEIEIGETGTATPISRDAFVVHITRHEKKRREGFLESVDESLGA